MLLERILTIDPVNCGPHVFLMDFTLHTSKTKHWTYLENMAYSFLVGKIYLSHIFPFSSSHVCVCVVCAFLCVCTFAYVWMSVYAVKIDVQDIPLWFFHFILWDRVCQSNPELTNEASHLSADGGGVGWREWRPFSGLNCKTAVMLTGQLHGFWGFEL